MKKLIFSIVLISVFSIGQSQSKYICKTGFIGFYSKTPMEEIKADNNQVAGIVDIQSGEVVVNVLIKSFKFERALMEEHFNENYMESDKFPKGSFKGKITNLSTINFSKDGSNEANVEGNLTVHGITNPYSGKVNIDVKGNSFTAKTKFLLKPSEYGIQIPGVVKEKIAENMDITVEMVFNTTNK